MTTRCGLLRIVQMCMLVGVLALGITPALAVHDSGIFQVDGDAFQSTCGGAFGTAACQITADDWNNLYSCSTPEGNCTAAVPGTGNSANVISPLIFDPSPLSIFIGGGSKDEQDITQ